METKKGFFGNIKDWVRKANQNQPAVWIQDSGISVVDGAFDGDKANEAAPNDKHIEESSKKPTTKRKSCGKKNADGPSLSSGLDELWIAAKESKGKKNLKESQVWVDDELYRKIEMLNLKSGKPVPTKHIVNAILQMFIDENNVVIAKRLKGK